MSIRYNVSALLREPLGSTREYELDERVLIEEDVPRHQQIAGHAEFLRTNSGVLVKAQLHGVDRERCSRCLREFELPVSLEIEEEFYVSVNAEAVDSPATEEDAAVFHIDAKHTLDLEEAVRQYWTAALPMQPLCQQNCRGLCDRCGQNLNQGDCSCSPKQDERWSALSQLAQKTKGE